MKCSLLSGCISVIQGDQKTVRRCYEDSLSVRRVNVDVVISPQLDDNGVNFVDFYQRIQFDREIITLTKYLKEVKIGTPRVSYHQGGRISNVSQGGRLVHLAKKES